MPTVLSLLLCMQFYQSIHILTNVIVSLQNDDIGEDVNRLVDPQHNCVVYHHF
jgi:hypothetical protein